MADFGGSATAPSVPQAPLVQASDGNFYGTTNLGGAQNLGTVFKMTPAAVVTTLYSFTGPDGSYPNSGLVQGSDGNLYGVTPQGGGTALGTVFRITTAGALTTLHSFAGSDGTEPTGALLQGTDGNFYGTTLGGGANNSGTVFQMTPAGAVTTLHSFGQFQDGSDPYGGLIQASDGNFYGTTHGGGLSGYGTVYRITPGGTLTIIYSFSSSSSSTVGNLPKSGVVQGKDGNFYGTTVSGGVSAHAPGGAGTVYKVTSGGAYTTLYSFCTQADCPDGYQPIGGVLQGTDGNFYGTTSSYGASTGGTIFKITPGGVLTTLYNFCSAAQCADGQGPTASLIQASDGNFYGTLPQGGTSGNGAAFRLNPGQSTTTGPYTCTNTSPPLVASVNSASSYGDYSYFASGSWLEIKGSNLADPNDPRLSAVVNPGQWTTADFNGVNAPTALDGISVSINGKPAYVWYLSPGQLNVQAPEDSTLGTVSVTVTNCKATSLPFQVTRQALAPGLLAPTNFRSGPTQYMVATFVSDGAYVLNPTLGASLGLNSRAAQPGDEIIAYGIGFGDVTPSILPGVIAGQSNTLANSVSIAFGSSTASIQYQGLAGGFVGLYEFFLTVPAGLAAGDYQLEVTQNGVPLPQILYLTVQ